MLATASVSMKPLTPTLTLALTLTLTQALTLTIPSISVASVCVRVCVRGGRGDSSVCARERTRVRHSMRMLLASPLRGAHPLTVATQ